MDFLPHLSVSNLVLMLLSETLGSRRERPGLRGQQQAIGTHTPALYNEILELVVGPDPSGVFIDGTFGRGGHSRGILSALGPAGRLHGLDMDPHAVEVSFVGVNYGSYD